MTCHGDDRAPESAGRPSRVRWHRCQVGSGDIGRLDQDDGRSEIAGERPQAEHRANLSPIMLGGHSPAGAMQE